MARVCCRVLVRRLAALLVLLAASALAQEPSGTGLFERPVLALDPGMHTAMINRADVDRSGSYAVTGSDDRTVRVWKVADGALLRTIPLPVGPGNVGKVFAVAISPDGALIAAGGWTRSIDADATEQIYLFARDSGKLLQRIAGLPGAVQHLTFSADGRDLAAVLGSGAGLRVYDREAGWAEVARDSDYGDESYGAAFAPDGRLATTSYDGKVRLYDPAFHLTKWVAAPGGSGPSASPSARMGNASRSAISTAPRSTCSTGQPRDPARPRHRRHRQWRPGHGCLVGGRRHALYREASTSTARACFRCSLAIGWRRATAQSDDEPRHRDEPEGPAGRRPAGRLRGPLPRRAGGGWQGGLGAPTAEGRLPWPALHARCLAGRQRRRLRLPGRNIGILRCRDRSRCPGAVRLGRTATGARSRARRPDEGPGAGRPRDRGLDQ